MLLLIRLFLLWCTFSQLRYIEQTPLSSILNYVHHDNFLLTLCGLTISNMLYRTLVIFFSLSLNLDIFLYPSSPFFFSKPSSTPLTTISLVFRWPALPQVWSSRKVSIPKKLLLGRIYLIAIHVLLLFLSTPRYFMRHNSPSWGPLSVPWSLVPLMLCYWFGRY